MDRLPDLRCFIFPVFVATLVATTARAESVHEARVAALRATLARAGISLEMRSVGDVVATAGCMDVEDREQPTDCSRCPLASERDTTDEVLATITAELDRYPTELLAQADIRTLSLCRRIEAPATRETFDGLAHYDGRSVMIVVLDGNVDRIVHHELLHMIESARLSDMNDDEAWLSTNPIGFSYETAHASSNVDRPDGFVRWYAATNVSEDRASVYEYMMARPDELCAIAAADPIVRAKVNIVWSRMSTYARGDELMAGTAPCVRELCGLPAQAPMPEDPAMAKPDELCTLRVPEPIARAPLPFDPLVTAEHCLSKSAAAPNDLWVSRQSWLTPPEVRIPLGAAHERTE